MTDPASRTPFDISKVAELSFEDTAVPAPPPASEKSIKLSNAAQKRAEANRLIEEGKRLLEEANDETAAAFRVANPNKKRYPAPSKPMILKMLKLACVPRGVFPIRLIRQVGEEYHQSEEASQSQRNYPLIWNPEKGRPGKYRNDIKELVAMLRMAPEAALLMEHTDLAEPSVLHRLSKHATVGSLIKEINIMYQQAVESAYKDSLIDTLREQVAQMSLTIQAYEGTGRPESKSRSSNWHPEAIEYARTGASNKEIAKRYGVNAKTVRNLLSAARKDGRLPPVGEPA